MFSKILPYFKKKNLVLAVASLMVLVMGYFTFGYLAKTQYASKAAGIETGYGCYNYGNSAGYGNCKVKLSSSDLVLLNPSLTTNGGIVCTPNPAEIGSKITCTGTLNGNRTAPQDVFSLGVEGGSLVACTFAGDVFTCPDIVVGNTVGSLKLFGSIGTDAAVDTTVKIATTNRVVVNTDLAKNDLVSTTGPYSSVVCGKDNTVNAGELSTCIFTIRPGFAISVDTKFGIGTNPGGQCTTSGSTLTCTGVPVTTELGAKDLKVQIGSGQVYLAGKTINVAKAGTVTTTANSSTNPSATSAAAALIRTGGNTVIYIVIAVIALLLLAVVIFMKHKKDTNNTKEKDNNKK
jgi:hypothetical protein